MSDFDGGQPSRQLGAPESIHQNHAHVAELLTSQRSIGLSEVVSDFVSLHRESCVRKPQARAGHAPPALTEPRGIRHRNTRTTRYHNEAQRARLASQTVNPQIMAAPSDWLYSQAIDLCPRQAGLEPPAFARS